MCVALVNVTASAALVTLTFLDQAASFPEVYFSGVNFDEDNPYGDGGISVPKFDPDWGTLVYHNVGFDSELWNLVYDVTDTGGAEYSSCGIGVSP